ncbi:MAG: ABC transporter ATP-binding protein [Alphaproteobacteria bacterium]|jgi:microcin C transport system ATP-binding protein|nr:ABC transporter ATP-binding protein [Alphaproteobacteria bacterium]
MSLLSIKKLSVTFGQGENAVRAVKEVSFNIEKGETLALVGESGSGKSVTALSILRLLPYPHASHPGGKIFFGEEEITDANVRSLRGNRIAMIFQEPMTSLNPLHTIEKQVSEVLFLHKNMNKEQARARTLELLGLVGLPEPDKRLSAYPHELSGGQRQRVMIAMALANDPDLLIADEPTTALDVTIQAQILTLLKDLQKRLGMALLLITHDLNIVRPMADKVCVMKDGEIVEHSSCLGIFKAPCHPYTKMLINSEPSGTAMPVSANAPTLLSAQDVKVYFPIKKGVLRKTVDYVRAVDDVSLTLRRGETIGIVGESGSGKTTLGLALLRLLQSQGTILFNGHDLSALKQNDIRPFRKQMQIVFQDPYGSLSPRMTVGDIIAEGLDLHGLAANKAERMARIEQALGEVGLDPAMHSRYPHEFSGGQRQRIAIARAMILNPSLVVLDEPTSALDRTVQAQIIELLRNLQAKHHLSYLFISHDLHVVKALSNYVLVMKNGRVVEQGEAEDIFNAPRESYTQALLKAAFRG